MSLLLSPLWLIILPLAMAPVVYIVRRREGLAALIAGATALVTARLCLSMPFDWSLQLFGRDMVLLPADRTFLAFAYLLVTCYFLYAWASSQGWSFFPFILIIMGIFSAATMLQNTIVAVLLLGMAATVTVLIIQAGRRRSANAGLHYLETVALAIPPLLVVAHLTEMRILNPSDATLPQLTGLLLILGLSLLLGAVPFQAWLGAVSAEAPPMVSAFVFSIASGVVLFKAFELFHRFPWLVQANGGNVLHLVALVGAASVIVGGVLAAFQRDFGKLLGWAVLVDTGFILIGLSSVSSEGLAVLALILLNRGIAVSLVGMGMGILRRERETDFFKAMTGIIWRKPFAVLGVTVGGLSLAGFPLTGGFTARWLAMQVLPASSRSWITLLILAGMAVSIGYLRGIAATTGESSIEPDEQEPLIVCVLILFLAVLTLVLALYPQLALQVLSPVMATLAIPR